MLKFFQPRADQPLAEINNSLTNQMEGVMKHLTKIFVFMLVVVFTNSIIAQELGSLRKDFQFSVPEKIQRPVGDGGQPAHRQLRVGGL